MKKLSGIKAFLAIVLCACMFLSNGAMITFADDATNSNISETYSFVDLPYHTGYSEFGFYDAGYTEYTLKIGLFDATKTDFNLIPFDTWDNGNILTHSEKTGAKAENWRWHFAENSSNVLVIKSKITGTIKFDFAGVSLRGWFDSWPFIFGLYRHNASDDSVTQLARNFQDSSAKPLDSATYTHTVEVLAGDTVYFEIGKWSGNDYNVQEINKGKIIVTPTVVNEVVAGAYGKKLDAKVSGLTQANYAESDWNAINEIVATFKTGAYADVNALLGAYNKAVADIDAITPDPLKDKRTNLINAMNAYVGGLVQSNYTNEAWAVITGAQSAFVGGASDCESESALQELYDAKMNEIKAVKAYKQTFTYLDYPSKMNANGYAWIEGEIFNTKLFAGTVANMKEFDSKGENENIMYHSSFNAGYDTPAYFVQNWKWFIGYNMGVITAYKAHVDMKLVITNTYIADGHSSNGWTEDCALTYYIVRGESVKEIAKVNAPSSDAQFGGEFYLKAGDMLYVEFNSTVINVGDVRNTEAPCGMKVEGDSTAFDQDLYAEQNNDLPADVVNAISEKKALLEEYYAGLTESDYSATNWLTLGQYVDQFAEKCESEVKTVEDVENLYNSIKAEMQNVPTIAQAQAELREALEGYAAEVKAEYDALIAANKYTAENKAKLDKALADGQSAIMSAKSKTVGNQEKVKAIAALKAVEVAPADSQGCVSSLLSTGFTSVLAVLAGLFIVRKRR